MLKVASTVACLFVISACAADENTVDSATPDTSRIVDTSALAGVGSTGVSSTIASPGAPGSSTTPTRRRIQRRTWAYRSLE